MAQHESYHLQGSSYLVMCKTMGDSDQCYKPDMAAFSVLAVDGHCWAVAVVKLVSSNLVVNLTDPNADPRQEESAVGEEITEELASEWDWVK